MRSTSIRLALRTILLINLSLAAVPAFAQDRLFAGTGALGAFGHFGDRLGPAPPTVFGRFAAGGRYVVSGSQAIDTRTGQPIVVLGGTVVGVDPRRPKVFVHDGTMLSIFDIESRTVTSLIPFDPDEFFDPGQRMVVRLAADTDELFVLRRHPRGLTVPGEFSVIDLATRAVTRSLPFTSPGVFQSVTDWHVTSDGRRVAVLTFSILTLIDGVTGAVVAQQNLGPNGDGTIVDDRRNGRLYVRQQHQLTAFTDDLRPLAALPLRSTCAQPAVAFSHHTGRLYVIDSQGGYHYFGRPIPIRHFLTVYDSVTGRAIDTRDITRAAGVPEGSNSCSALPLAVLTAPGAPSDLAATINGRDVALSWTNVGDASDFVLDAGLAPGLTDVAFSIGPSSPVTLANAPPGTYFLRVRGTNEFGVSRPSNEVVVTVP